MGFVQKKDNDKEEIDGIEVIGRGEGPDGLDLEPVELVDGQTAEDISGTTAARDAGNELEADPELLGEVPADDDDDADGKDASAGGSDGGAPEPPHAQGGSFFAKYGKLCMAAAIVAVIAAGIIGYFVGSGGFGDKGADAAALTEDQLDVAVASWSYKGSTHVVTAREAIESQYSLESAKGEDGTYSVPPAEALISYVRNQVLAKEADSLGAVPTEDEMLAYAEETLGTSDFEVIAEQYGVSTEQARAVVEQQAKIKKLYDTVVTDAPEMPVAPEEPKEGEESEATEAYAAYILKLVGDEWNAEKGEWADPEGMYAAVFTDNAFDGKTATYEQAQMAFYVAYQTYANNASASTESWTAYVNDIFANVDLSLYGIFA